MKTEPEYLTPYLTAARRSNGGFASLLWASPATQEARFNAICRMENLTGRSILDVGCGRADLLDFLHSHNMWPADYVGIEAIPELAEVARSKNLPNATIVQADFVEQPAAMFVGADMVIISGSLNTLDTKAFYTTIQRAFDASAEAVVFNFLDSFTLAAASYLTWHDPEKVLAFARSLSRDVRLVSDYLAGDSTISIRKEQNQP